MSTPLVASLADAITRQEGFAPGTVSYRNNNPGNIMDLDYYRETGKFRVRAYETLAEGRAALEALVGKYISRGNTLLTMFRAYAPSGHGDNSPDIYARNVGSWLGLPIDIPLNSLTTSSPSPENGGAGRSSLPSEEPTAEQENYLPLLAIAGALGLAIWLLLD